MSKSRDIDTPAKLRRAREELGMTQQELADELGLSWSSIAKMETGLRPITNRTSRQVLLLLGHKD